MTLYDFQPCGQLKTKIADQLDFEVLSFIISGVLNCLRTNKRKTPVKLKVFLSKTEFSYYTSGNKIYITPYCFDKKKFYKWCFINALLHECFHFLQVNLDHLPEEMFPDNIEGENPDFSNANYFNNVTEKQARVFTRLTMRVLSLYEAVVKYTPKLQPLISIEGTMNE